MIKVGDHVFMELHSGKTVQGEVVEIGTHWTTVRQWGPGLFLPGGTKWYRFHHEWVLVGTHYATSQPEKRPRLKTFGVLW